MAKKAPKKTSAAKKAPGKKAAAPKKKAPAQKSAAPKKKVPAKKVAAPKKAAGASKSASKQKPTPSKKTVAKPKAKAEGAVDSSASKPKKPVAPLGKNGSTAEPAVLDKFTQLQHKRLLDLRDSLVDAMAGVAQDNLRSRAEGSEASAFGMHQADAGSDAYDRDFALNLLSQEQDALYEIEEALTRVKRGTYGVCEVSGKKIPKARLEAIPYARLTVECQAEFEKENFGARGARRNVRSIFGLMESESEVDSSDDND
jgi:DnaK suppressor protein